MKLEYKSLTFDVKSEFENDGAWIIEGYASTYDVDNGKDRIVKGAFVETIEDRYTRYKDKGVSKIKVLWQHNNEMIIGKLLEIREDSEGLYCKLELFNDESFPEAAKAYKLAKWGQIDSFSIGYRALEKGKEEKDEETIRLIKKLKLYEISIVTFPMNELAEFTNVKAEEENDMSEKILELLTEIKSLLSKPEETVVLPAEVIEDEKAKGCSEPDEDDMSEKEMCTCSECGNIHKAAKKAEEVSVSLVTLTADEVKSMVKELFENYLKELKELNTPQENAPIQENIENKELSLESLIDSFLDKDISL